MVLFDGILGVVAFGLWMFCIIDVITTGRDQVRNLPKLGWLAIVILFAAIGAVAWLVFGRPWVREPALVGAARPKTVRASSPDDDDEFLAALDAHVQEQRRARDRDERPDDT
ncbi:PLD nuclease N-terminal domain-containing protein [uncultured Jatrophihabitans sp.]|uniref:PLD nuclease N-terminal domain-containing protein n=1 Tax=uncultured Jatrophihabitans sp. TaxID=1610747 RepID=UPI0035C9A874